MSELVSLHFLLIKIDVILFNLSQQCKAKFDEFSLFSKCLPKILVNGRTLINKNLIDISHGHRDKSINVQDSILKCVAKMFPLMKLNVSFKVKVGLICVAGEINPLF